MMINFKTAKSKSLSMVSILLSVFFMLLASASVKAESPAEQVKKLVSENTQMLMQRLEKSKPLYYSNADAFYKEMEDALSSLVDFRRIAARVMGKYGRAASKDQRDLFVETFKKSLFASYAKALVESGKFTVQITGVDMLSADNSKASVDIEITSETGNKYVVAYSMYMNSKTNAWLLENIIVSGINVGLAFRDRFEQEMRNHKGNMDTVIANWNAELDISTKEQG